jgi:hypothetical protein
VSSEALLTPIIVFIGVLSSIASDAGYLVLIPLGAAAFKSVGRNPLAGIAAAFAGVAAGFGVNFLITPLDGVLTEITNDASHCPIRADRPASTYFGIADGLRRHRTRRSMRRRALLGARPAHEATASLDADNLAGAQADARRLMPSSRRWRFQRDHAPHRPDAPLRRSRETSSVLAVRDS